MKAFSVSISGNKESAARQAILQITNGDERNWVLHLIEGAPGTHVSLSGSLSVAEDGSHGSISLSGSFWSS